MTPFYVCDRSNYVRFGNDKIHSCGRHDVLTAEGTCCPGTLKPAFFFEDIKSAFENQMSHERQYQAIAQTQTVTIECASSLNTLRELLETIEGKIK